MSKQKRILHSSGYIMVYMPDHHRAQTKASLAGYVYEHIVVAERIIGRKIKLGEDVHHLDICKSNNRPANLLVLDGMQHSKLHKWLQRIGYLGNPQATTIKDAMKKCHRCSICEWPIQKSEHKFHCSLKCRQIAAKNIRPSKAKLERLLSRYSWVKVGAKYNVSDNAVRKWAIAYGINPKDFANGRRR